MGSVSGPNLYRLTHPWVPLPECDGWGLPRRRSGPLLAEKLLKYLLHTAALELRSGGADIWGMPRVVEWSAQGGGVEEPFQTASRGRAKLVLCRRRWCGVTMSFLR